MKQGNVPKMKCVKNQGKVLGIKFMKEGSFWELRV